MPAQIDIMNVAALKERREYLQQSIDATNKELKLIDSLIQCHESPTGESSTGMTCVSRVRDTVNQMQSGTFFTATDLFRQLRLVQTSSTRTMMYRELNRMVASNLIVIRTKGAGRAPTQYMRIT